MGIKLRNVDKTLVNWIQAQGGIGPQIGDIFYTAPAASSTSQFYTWLNTYMGIGKGHLDTSLATMFAEMKSGRNDTMIIQGAGAGNALAKNLDININCANFLGGAPGGKMAMRSRISMSTAFTPMMTVSGYGNTFANLYFQHGTGTADLIGLSITGNYNSFYNCHIATPLFAALGDQSGYKGISIVATGTYFKDCIIGMNTIARTGAYPTVYINAPSTAYGYTRFDNCTFLMQGAANTQHVLIDNTGADQDETFVEFNGCRFICTGQNMPAGSTYAIMFSATAAAGSTCGVFIDPACQFFNCGSVTANNYANVWVPTPGLPAANGHLAAVAIKAT